MRYESDPNPSPWRDVCVLEQALTPLLGDPAQYFHPENKVAPSPAPYQPPPLPKMPRHVKFLQPQMSPSPSGASQVASSPGPAAGPVESSRAVTGRSACVCVCVRDSEGVCVCV